MRILLALSIIIMQASFIAAEPSLAPKVVTCDYVRFEALVSISEPFEIDLELTGELFVAPSGIRIVATNALTNEDLWIIVNREASEITFLFPDTLNGVSKVVAENSPIWILLSSGIKQSELLKHPEITLKDVEAIVIRKTEYPGTRYETERKGYLDIWWEPEGNPKRLVFHDDNNHAQFDFLGFEQAKEVASDLFEIGPEFAIRQASSDETLNLFQL